MSPPTFPALLEGFFTKRLMQQRQASAHTIASYRDTFRLLLQFAQKHLHRAPSTFALEDIDATLVGAFLDDLEMVRKITPRTRNLRLTAIHSFFRYVAFEDPARAAQIQRVLAIPPKRFTRTLHTSRTRKPTRSQARSLLSMAKLNRASSRRRTASCSRIRIAQISLSLKGVFWPTILPLFQGGRAVAVFSVASMADSYGEGANKSALCREFASRPNPARHE